MLTDGAQTPFTWFGFTREEWLLAYSADPRKASDLARFLDHLSMAAPTGGLASIGIDAMRAIAAVSPGFAGRLRSQLETTDPTWRASVERLFSDPTGGAEREITRSQWRRLFDLLDAL